jgi:hypothetical protein
MGVSFCGGVLLRDAFNHSDRAGASLSRDLPIKPSINEVIPGREP